MNNNILMCLLMSVMIILLIVDICKKRENKEGFECESTLSHKECESGKAFVCIYDNDECKRMSLYQILFDLFIIGGIIFGLWFWCFVSVWISAYYDEKYKNRKIILSGIPIFYFALFICIIGFGIKVKWTTSLFFSTTKNIKDSYKVN